MNYRAVAYALASAALFGASTPFAKLLLGDVRPALLAGVLYLGSGIGLLAWIVLRPSRARAMLPPSDYRWLAAAIVAGGIMAPVLLVSGLARMEASGASLLLNLEAVFTAAIAWLAFRENVDRRILLGMLCIVAGGVLLSGHELPRAGSVAGPLFVAGACLGWALDNNFTRRISGADAATVACMKGLVAGAFNTALALSLGTPLPPASSIGAAALVGLLGYGVSLVLFIVALRHLGTARTAAYFSVAPFFGALLALPLLGEGTSLFFWAAAALMALGVWLHVSERHEHRHAHEALEHDHLHVHDEHHRHPHEGPVSEPHAHPHRHDRLVHSHPHYPDLHHRHEH